MSAPTAAELRSRPHRRGSGVRRVWSCFFFLLGLGALLAPVCAEVTGENQLKAAFVYNFTKFVEWPAKRFADESNPIAIGVFRANLFADEVEKIIRGRTVNGRELVVKRIVSSDDAGNVDLLFVPAGEEKRIIAALASINSSGVLTVGESEAFAAAGGIITFTVAEDKVRFVINQYVAERSNLKVSAQLLKLATVVRRQP